MSDRAPQEHPGEEPAADPGNHPGGRPSGRRARDAIHRDDIHRDRRSTGDAVGDAAGDDTADGTDGVDIPVPRPPLDDLPVTDHPAVKDLGSELAEIGLVEPVWRYDQQWTRGKDRRYNGYVDRIGGVEGQRLRESLAAVIRDLLGWAAQHTENADSNGDSTGESGTDSSRDGGADDTPA